MRYAEQPHSFGVRLRITRLAHKVNPGTWGRQAECDSLARVPLYPFVRVLVARIRGRKLGSVTEMIHSLVTTTCVDRGGNMVMRGES